MLEKSEIRVNFWNIIFRREFKNIISRICLFFSWQTRQQAPATVITAEYGILWSSYMYMYTLFLHKIADFFFILFPLKKN